MNEITETKKDGTGGRLITNFIFLVLYIASWAIIPIFVFKKGLDEMKAAVLIAIAINVVLILLTLLVPYFRRGKWLRWWAYLGALDVAWWIYCLVK